MTPSAGPLPRPTQPVKVTVGGESVTVNYAGGAPGLTAGLLQVNVTLPADVALGDSVPVALTVGTATSSGTVTAAIAKR